MGRPPKSVEDHIANGTYKKSRHEGRGITIEPLEKLPAPPSLSKRASEKWDEIVPAMLSAGLVSVVDAVILKDAFTSYDIAQDCLEQVNGYESYGVYLRGIDKTKQMNLLEYNAVAFAQEIAQIDMDSMSPRDAMNLLYVLREKARKL